MILLWDYLMIDAAQVRSSPSLDWSGCRLDDDDCAAMANLLSEQVYRTTAAHGSTWQRMAAHGSTWQRMTAYGSTQSRILNEQL